MAITLEDAARNAATNAVTALINGGVSPGTMDIRASTTVLSTVTFSDPAFTGAVGGVGTADTITGDASIAVTGVADNYQVKDSDAGLIWSGTCGNPASGADMEISPSASLVELGTFDVSSMTLTTPAS